MEYCGVSEACLRRYGSAWFNIMASRGDALGAAKQMAAAQIAARFDQHYASLAHTILAIDVTTGNLDIRAFVLDELSAMAGHPRPAEHGSPAVATPAK